MNGRLLEDCFVEVQLDGNVPMQGAVWKGMLEEAQAMGFPLDLQLSFASEDPWDGNPKCAGLVTVWGSEERARRLAELPFPVINVSNAVGPVPRVVNLLSDDRAVGRMAAEHLIASGHRTLLAVGQESCFARERTEGFEKAARGAGCAVSRFTFPEVSVPGGWSPSAYTKELTRVLGPQLRAMPPNAGIFAVADWAAEPLRGVLRLAFPERIHTTGLLGVDDAAPTQWIAKDAGGLSSVLPGFRAIGRAAVRWMATGAGQKPQETVVERFPPERLVRRSSTAGYACEHPVAARAGRWIWQQVELGTPPTLVQLAATLRMSPRSTERLFAAHYQCGTKEFVMRVQMDRARQMLADPRARIGDVAAACGFASQTVFGRVFREREGCTPREWRERQRG